MNLNNLLSAVGALLALVCYEVHAAKNRPCAYYCTCDVFSGLTRANCSGQGVTSPKVKLPYRVQELNLSFNNITTLDGSSFERLVYLVNLTIAYNALHTIHPAAFASLQEIASIDLSYNRLEHFDERTFETNTKLTRLDLSGNNFASLNNKPMIVSKSLQYLWLRDANITNLYPLLFMATPALEELDVSGNPLITTTSATFTHLPRLRWVKLEDHRWKSDENMVATLKYLNGRDVRTSPEHWSSNAMASRAWSSGERFMKPTEVKYSGGDFRFAFFAGIVLGVFAIFWCSMFCKSLRWCKRAAAQDTAPEPEPRRMQCVCIREGFRCRLLRYRHGDSASTANVQRRAAPRSNDGGRHPTDARPHRVDVSSTAPPVRSQTPPPSYADAVKMDAYS